MNSKVIGSRIFERCHMRWLILLFLFVPLSDGLAHADYYDGLRAYDAKDYATAVREWQQTANAGDAQAQFRLGQLYKEGRGTPKNILQAHLYYYLASVQGHKEAEAAREAMFAQMDSSELAEAFKIVNAWKPSSTPPQPINQLKSQEARPAENPEPLFSPNPLWEAAAQGDRDLVNQLINAGMDVDASDKQGWTALHLASAEGQKGMVQQLLDAGADVTKVAKDGATALWVALLGGHHEVLLILIQSGADLTGTDPTGRPPLLVAVELKDVQAVTVFLRNGALPNASTNDGTTPLMAAAATGQTGLIEQLIQHGAEVNAVNQEGATALMLAAATGQPKALEFLIQSGSQLDIKTNDGLTTLAIAQRAGQKDVVELLLKHAPVSFVQAVGLGSTEVVKTQLDQGADPNTKDADGWPVLLLAAAEGNPAIVSLLLKAGADVDGINSDGTTALMAATYSGHEQVVQTLLAAGADLKVMNKLGLTAFAIAKKKNVRKIIGLFPLPPKRTNAKDGAPMVLIPAGEFLMGANFTGRGPSGVANYYWHEKDGPMHTVYLDAFYMDKYEITTSRWKKFIRGIEAKNALVPYWGDKYLDLERDGDRPVVGMEWQEAQAYCVWAGKRLPTEAEWEKAARGTDGRTYPWGSATPTAKHLHANVKWPGWKDDELGKWNYSYIDTVGMKPAGESPYGVHNMAGNVAEIVADWFDENYYSTSPRENPKGPATGKSKARRSAPYYKFSGSKTTWSRSEHIGANYWTGFRCAQDAK